MFNLFPIRLFALSLYLSTFTNVTDDIWEVSNALSTGYFSYYGKVMEYEASLLQNGYQLSNTEASDAQQVFPEVNLPSGTTVKGKQHSKTRTFHNIPYAQAPIGNLR